ncbi:S8 family serine peptidase [Archangium violaceum]|uniref:S8 family serine peptidase n=1 Tax=Archangium violaceum TaxID=83451 RepID=UPI002B315543|nr:S8 family serine peptidase [Archangium gephyra]
MVTSLRGLVVLGLLLLLGASSSGCSCGSSDGGADGGTPPGGSTPDGGTGPLDETVYPDGPFPNGGGFVPPPSPPIRTGTLALTRSRITSAWSLLPSMPAARIALLDTGVDTSHPNLTGRIGPGYDYVRDTADVVDTQGHGTAMAGALAGSGTGSSSSFAGACPACIVLPYRVLAATAEVNAVDFNARAARAVQAAVSEGAHVIVFGVSSPVATAGLTDAIQQALAQGIPVVAPAGNDGATELEFPASLPGVISVGATYNASDLSHERSNNAPGLTVLAPGESMLSLAPGGGFETFGHTSLATALVGGTAALLRGTWPSLRPEAVSSLLRGWAVPLDPAPSSEALGFGRLDAHAAIEKVAGPGGGLTPLMDLAIGYAELLPARPKSGDKAWAAVRVENRGITEVDLTGRSVRLWVNHQYVNKQPLTGRLRPGERIEVRIFWPVTQPPGQLPVAVELAHSAQSSPADTVPDDDLRAIQEATLVTRAAPDVNAPLEDLRAIARTEMMLEPEIVAGDRDDLRIIAITSPDERRVGKTDRSFHVHLANHGTRTEEGRQLAWSLPGQGFPEVPVPTLLPGQSGIVELAWHDFTGGDLPELLTLSVNIVPPGGGTVGPLQRHAFRFRYLPSGGSARTEYVDLPGRDMVVDAPFRIDSTRDDIPVLFFAPDYGTDQVRFSLMHLSYSRTSDFSRPYPEVRTLYSQRDDQGSASWRPAKVVDAWGRIQQNDSSTLLFPPVPLNHRTQGGWHAILRVPWSHLETMMAPSLDDPDGPAYYLRGSIYVKRTSIFWRLLPYADEDELAFRRILKVVRNRLPRLAGRDRDHYFDAHFHTINEYIQDPGILSPFTRALLPFKAWGGPLVMAVESAHAQGFISQDERDGWAHGSAANRITFTDHNVFLTQNTAVSHSPDHCPGFGPTRPDNGSCDEFAVMRRLFDKGAGEELAIADGANTLPIGGLRGGAHLLSYGDTHRDGPWHGGSADQPNPLEVGALLERIAQGPSTDDPFAFAAHPFDRPQQWGSDRLTRALGYGVAPPTHPSAGLTFKGFQVWNQKKEFCRSFRDSDLFSSVNPFPGTDTLINSAAWARSSAYRMRVHDNVREWVSRIRRGLRYNDPGGTGTMFRKVFAVGGTDAHGDFNYTTDVTSTLGSVPLLHAMQPRDEHSVCSNAWGMVRTLAMVDSCSAPEDCPRGLTCVAGACVGSREKQDAPALSAMGHGRAVVTDGPVAHMAFDAQTQFSSRTLQWNDKKLRFTDGTADPWFDVDGYMGGAGRFDGAGTALMPVNGPVVDDSWESDLNSTGSAVRVTASWGSNASQAVQETRLNIVFPAESNLILDEFLTYYPFTFIWDTTLPGRPAAENSPAYLPWASANSVDRPLGEPFALFYSGSSVRRSGSLTPAFEFLTNPIWVAPVPIMVRNNAECVSGSSRLTRVAVRLRIPLTLNEATPFAEVYLQAVDPATGLSGGPKYPLTPSAGYPRDTGVGAGQVVRGEHQYEATLDVQLLGASLSHSGHYIIVFRDPKDPHDNVLNSFAVRRTMPSCSSSFPLCCEFNPTGLSRDCFSYSLLSRTPSCGSCEVTCKATERCAEGKCVDNFSGTCGGVTCTPPQTCCHGRCMSFVNNDKACGACGNACKTNERCCGTTCVPLGTESNCLDCGDACTAEQTCCMPGGCRDLSSSPTSCGGCLRQCNTTSEPLCQSGECIAWHNASSCGATGAACGAGEGCCPIFENPNSISNIIDYACRPLNTASDCGKCNEWCRASRCAEEPRGMRCGDACDDGNTCIEGVCQ